MPQWVLDAPAEALVLAGALQEEPKSCQCWDWLQVLDGEGKKQHGWLAGEEGSFIAFTTARYGGQVMHHAFHQIEIFFCQVLRSCQTRSSAPLP